jgi:hypothetical protein
MNVTYRRAVQRHFATLMADADIAAVHRVIDRLTELDDGEATALR